MVTNLVVHHGISNVFNQTPEFIRILDVVQKTDHLAFPSSHAKFSENVIQLPDGPKLLGSAPHP